MAMIPAMKNRHSGFTTMELLTTVVLAGVLVSLAIPSYSRFVASSRVTEQTTDIIGVLNLGRSEAIRRNQTLTFCRAADATATACATADAVWQHWILRTATGDVLRRGSLNTYGGNHLVSSTLTNESIDFGSDGLSRTGGALVNGHRFTVCSKKYDNENIRTLTLGASSRISNVRSSGTCS